MTTNERQRTSVRLAQIYGIDVKMHWTFLVLVVLVVGATMGAGIGAVGAGLLWIAAVFGSVLVHEFAHCVVARRRGAVVQDILLLPIGGMSRMEKIPEAPADEFAIAVIGPLTSLGLGLLAIAGGLVLHASLWPPTLFAGSWLARLAWLNFLLGAFNLLPALPMDGGRVLRSFLSMHHDRRDATYLAGEVARLLAFVMIVGGVFYDLWLVVIGFFVLLGATAEEQATEIPTRYRTRGKGPPTPAHG
jgi:Zn-dependent protease